MTWRKPSPLPAECCEQFVRAGDGQSAGEIAADIGGGLTPDETASGQERDAPATAGAIGAAGAIGTADAGAVAEGDHGSRGRAEHPRPVPAPRPATPRLPHPPCPPLPHPNPPRPP